MDPIPYRVVRALVAEEDSGIGRRARGIEKVRAYAAYQVAEVYAWRGEKDSAFQWLERARQQRDPGLASLRKDPLLVNIHNDSRWNPFLHSVGMADEQLK